MKVQSWQVDFGLLILRASLGLIIAVNHGWGKVLKIFGSAPVEFADPLGLGAMPSLILAGSAEFLGGLFVAMGLLTRWASVPLIVTMAVAAFIYHAEDPFSRKELALVYLFSFMTLFFTGPGRFSLDRVGLKRR